MSNIKSYILKTQIPVSLLSFLERLNFRIDWTVSLETLFLSNNLQNIVGGECRYIVWTPLDAVTREKSFIIQSGNYNTISSLLYEISESFKKESMPFYIDEVKGGRVTGEY